MQLTRKVATLPPWLLSPLPEWRHRILVPFLLLLTLLVYYPGLSGGFVYDDGPNLLENPQIKMKAFTWKDFLGTSFSSGSGQLRRPVAVSTLALTLHFLGKDPFPFKLFNLAIHMACGVVLFFFTYRFLTLFRRLRDPGLSETIIRQLTFFVACGWLLHPLNLTPVLYVVQRMTSLSALFLLSGCLFYLHQREKIHQGGGNLAIMLFGVALFLVLSVFSKENGILLPLFLLILEGTLFRFRNQEGGWERRSLLFFLLVVVLPGLIGVVLFIQYYGQYYHNFSLRTFSLSERLLTEARVMFFYLRLFLSPSNRTLGLFHDDFPLSRGWLEPETTLPSVAAILILPFLGVWWLRHRPLLGLGILWFLVAHVLESTVFPLILVFEHRNYVALWGLLLPMGHFLLNPPIVRTILPVWRWGAMLFLLVVAVVTLQRAVQWGDPLIFRMMEAENHPQSAIATLESGRYLAEVVMAGGMADTGEARALLEHSAALSKDTILAESGLILMTYKMKKQPDPAWIASMERKLTHAPVQHQSVSSLISLIHCQEKQVCHLPMADLERLFAKLLANPMVNVKNKALVHTAYAIFKANLADDPETALASFQIAARDNPGEAQYHVNLARLALAMGRTDLARQAVEELARRDRFGVYWRELESLRKRLEGKKS